MQNKQQFQNIWNRIYGSQYNQILENFLSELQQFKQNSHVQPSENEWYKDVTVYSIYVDLFNKDFKGLEEKLDYLSKLGVSCLWLLPVLDSPMRDAGFDIKDYRKIRPDLMGGNTENSEFEAFLKTAHNKGIKVIFDIAINHVSEENFWFQEAKKSKDNLYRDYFIWSKEPDKYLDARIIFKGIEESNWQKCGDEFFFHRFFDFQPDLNYRNPQVLIEMTRNLLYWLNLGVDGFRADAIPYLWKEEGTECENLQSTHDVVKFFRLVLDYIRPNTLMLAEACQKPVEVIKYFGSGDECHAGYHFPLMPMIFKSLAAESSQAIRNVLSHEITPEIPDSAQWFTFLRCHDELSLELVYVSEEDRKFIHESYCKKEQWNFREGQGISSRLSELMDKNPQKIGLAYSIMLSLPGTPVIYYGDEFGKLNDEKYYQEMIRVNGKDDTRFLVRGRIDWQELENELKNPESYSSEVFKRVKKLVTSRKKFKAFGRGKIEWLSPKNIENQEIDSVLMYKRRYANEEILIIQNLSNQTIELKIEGLLLSNPVHDLLGNSLNFNSHNASIVVEPFGYHWM